MGLELEAAGTIERLNSINGARLENSHILLTSLSNLSSAGK